LGKTSSCCNLDDHVTSDPTCGPADTGTSDKGMPQQGGRTGCC
jgi:hypothetical protein